MTDIVNVKCERLKRRLRSLESAVVAFSGGVDSTLLLTLAHQELHDRVLAVTAVSASLPKRDRTLVQDFCRERGIRHQFLETQELNDPRYRANPENRCYICKQLLLTAFLRVADEQGLHVVIEGTNASDLTGHRPGYKASQEQSRVITPLIETEFTKAEVRIAARNLGLAIHARPAAACLASRIPTGCEITEELLSRIDAAEDCIRTLGVTQVRVRHHGDLARIEVDPKDLTFCLSGREVIASTLRSLGWRFITLDLIGYRTHGMHE